MKRRKRLWRDRLRSFLAGAASITIWPPPLPVKRYRTDREALKADWKAIRGDWKKVEGDLQRVIEREVKKERETKK